MILSSDLIENKCHPQNVSFQLRNTAHLGWAMQLNSALSCIVLSCTCVPTKITDSSSILADAQEGDGVLEFFVGLTCKMNRSQEKDVSNLSCNIKVIS